MFDPKTIAELKCYVYLLINPASKTPFYVGKGTGNRIFNHLQNAKDGKRGTDKLTEIQHILEQNLEVEHVIVRHGLNDKTAFNIEAALIDTFKYIPSFKTFVRGNIQGGINSIEKGLMNAEEIARKYNAEPLDRMTKECVIININSSYKRASGENRIYQATKEIWKMKDPRKSYGFDGQVAPDIIRDKYINKSVAHKKKHGASNPITLNL